MIVKGGALLSPGTTGRHRGHFCSQRRDGVGIVLSAIPFFCPVNHMPSVTSESCGFYSLGTRSGPGVWPTAHVRTDAS